VTFPSSHTSPTCPLSPCYFFDSTGWSPQIGRRLLGNSDLFQSKADCWKALIRRLVCQCVVTSKSLDSHGIMAEKVCSYHRAYEGCSKPSDQLFFIRAKVHIFVPTVRRAIIKLCRLNPTYVQQYDPGTCCFWIYVTKLRTTFDIFQTGTMARPTGHQNQHRSLKERHFGAGKLGWICLPICMLCVIFIFDLDSLLHPFVCPPSGIPNGGGTINVRSFLHFRVLPPAQICRLSCS
jgi:hypothetical protein